MPQVPGSPGDPATGGAATGDAATPVEARRYYEQSTRLVLWRHGQTRWNVEGRFQGQSDIPLDPVGEQQAERAARLLAGLRPDAIVSSDLSRAMATAAPLVRLTGLTVTTDKDLRERYGGLWEGLTDAEIRARFPAEHAAWLPPEGESSALVAERAGAAQGRCEARQRCRSRFARRHAQADRALPASSQARCKESGVNCMPFGVLSKSRYVCAAFALRGLFDNLMNALDSYGLIVIHDSPHKIWGEFF